MTGSPSKAVKDLINKLIKDYKDCGYWSLSDVIVRFNLFNAQEGLLNLKGPFCNAWAVNSPIFTVYYGYGGDGISKYINTNFTPSVNGSQYKLNDAHAYINCYTVDDSVNGSDGAMTAVSRLNWGTTDYMGNYTRINTLSQTNLKKLVVGNNFYGRLNSNNVEGWHEGVKTSNTIASVDLPSVPVYIFSANYTSRYWHSSRYYGYSFGAYLSDPIKAAVKAANGYFNENIIGLIP
jgi:hypothetical protein